MSVNKKIIGGGVIGTILAAAVVGFIYVGANDDQTCYSYTAKTGSCTYTSANCTDWSTSKRVCNGIKTTTYSVAGTYRCANSNANKSPTNAACTIEETDNTPPTITGGGVQ